MTQYIIYFLIIIILLIIIFIYYKKNKKTEYSYLFKESYHKKYKQSQYRPDCIFISVASYRDTECDSTITDIFKKAKEPEKIFIGICQQNKSKSENCLKNIDDKYKSQIREDNMPYSEARGPTWARYICSHLWDGEEYFMQIDSHSRFLPNWDEKVKKIYKMCPPGKNILTHYPPNHNKYKELLKDPSPISFTCTSHFKDNFHIISEAKVVSTKKTEPMITPYVSAGFIFSTSDLLQEVPFDPYLPYLFQGEEILLSSRIWTNGWNMYNPHEAIITHYYKREKQGHPHFWDDQKNYKKIQNETKKRYYYLLGQYKKNEVNSEFLKHAKEYGMGNSRTLDEWFDFVGIDMKNKEIKSRCNSTYDLNKNEWIENK